MNIVNAVFAYNVKPTLMLNVMKHPFFFFRQLENIVGFYRFAPDIQCFIKNRLSFIDLDSCTPLKSRQLQEKHHKAL